MGQLFLNGGDFFSGGVMFTMIAMTVADEYHFRRNLL